ncbi:galactose oxidase early set domain-containing protein [Actinoplanes sp. NEAU-A12]|uniref:Galactose oxidase early set domain-containing protein n=1 Tax=Actinoplanes sandaracinus TaxID=3045177 RepID=A0ABT6WBS9_9ACTN|nr:galactose oxidase early set domain-containing protein [Actinoplanes sandaracinus]MDI6097181.1 galactose oxidase early set domain-containing protein [Actinoplanes sandaracinus]
MTARRQRPTLTRRVLTMLVTLPLMAAVVVVNRPIVGFAAERYHEFTINRLSYKQRFGHWSMLHVPGKFKVNAIHAALLRTGKVLIIAGSGNDRENFEAGTFRTVLWDPRTDTFRDVPTPTDLFCAGHTFLPNGNLLVAGGTKSYEVLEADITNAAGVMKIKNESPDSGPRTFGKGTRLLGANGRVYLTRAEVTVPAATKMTHGNRTMVHAGEAEVWVDALDAGDGALVTEPGQYAIEGLGGDDARNLYGIAEKITREKQEYGGDKTSYEFDPIAERYVRTGDMVEHRWYPTLATMPGGDILAVSGLDEFGRMLPGVNERYQVAKRQWTPAPELRRVFPTYPALFLTEDEKLFFSGSNAGYGSDTEGRAPGLWDVAKNEFTTVPGLEDPGMTETSASVLLPPAQDQKVMILGGGAVGDSPVSTARTAIADLDDGEPRYRPGPDLPAPTRYLNTVVLPDDTVFTSGGSSGYRGGPYQGRARSDLLTAHLYDPRREEFREVAAPDVGRNYHSEALLLADGRVVTMGSDPIYDTTGTNPGRFEQRIEIYSPPYLFQGDRPALGGGPRTVKHGRTAPYATGDADRIAAARLVRPSAVTHGTDVDQRSVELGVRRTPGGVTVTIPEEPGLVPSGWYMLFLIDDKGVPSRARWVRVA